MADNYNTGGWFLAGGIFISVVGLVLTGTGIGAICGLPLIFFVGLPMKIFGIVQMRKSRKVQISQIYYPPQTLPPQTEYIVCRKCGFNNNFGSKFCYSCGGNLLMNVSENK